MDEIGKILVGSSPILAVVLVLGTQLIAAVKEIAKDWQLDRAAAAADRETIKLQIQDVARRVNRLEEHQIGNSEPVNPSTANGQNSAV